MFQVDVNSVFCSRSHIAFNLMQVISSLGIGGGPHMVTTVSHAVPPSIYQQICQNAAIEGGASLAGRQEQHHMHTVHPYQTETTPSMANIATLGVVERNRVLVNHEDWACSSDLAAQITFLVVPMVKLHPLSHPHVFNKL